MFKPLYDRILVKRAESQSVSKGGLFLPESSKEKPSEGLVVAVGAGRVLESGALNPLLVREGDHVFFGRYAGHEVRVGEDTFLVMREDEVLGTLGG